MILKKGETITRKHLDDELIGKIIFRFVTIEIRLKKDVGILDSWVKTFEKDKIPFLISEHTVGKYDKRTLWKEEVSVSINIPGKGRKPRQRYKK